MPLDKLSNLIKTYARHSSVDIVCQVNPNHVSKTYVHIIIGSAHIVQESKETVESSTSPTTAAPRLDIKACVPCYVQYLADGSTVLAEVRDIERH